MANSGRLEFVIPPELDGRPLDAAVRLLAHRSWQKARDEVRSGKVSLGSERATRPEQRVAAGDVLTLNPNAPRVQPGEQLAPDAIVFCDTHVVVVRKPAGVSTVPFEPGERGSLDELVSRLLHKKSGRRGPAASLGVVQRLDKETSGLLVFARTFVAKKVLAQQLRSHSMWRRYLALAHGNVPAGTLRSFLVPNRGDGLRGAARHGEPGQLAVTHVEPLEVFAGATLVRCRLETGRTHQIRVHLAESGHPLLGERVYVRDFSSDRLPAPRVMLHAAELGFVHPVTEGPMRFDDPPPADFEARLRALRAGAQLGGD